MAGNTIRVRLEVNQSTSDLLREIIECSNGFEIQNPAEKRRPDLLILELGADADTQFDNVESLLEQDAVGEVFLTAGTHDQAMLRRAMRAGVKEFFPQPIAEDEVRQALESFRERYISLLRTAPEKPCRVIDVVGSKGGVGTTTIAVNLAVDLAQIKGGPSVALVDMNMLFGEVPTFLDINPSYHWGQISRDVERMDATFLASVMTVHPSGVHILTSPQYLDARERVTPDAARRLLGLMRELYGAIVIDAGHSIDDTSLTILEMSDDLLIVSILSLPCLSNTNKLLKCFSSLGYPMERVKIVANRWLKKSEISLDDAEAGIGEKFFWVLPNDYNTTMAAINRGEPLSQVAPKAAITRKLKEMADALAPEEKGAAVKAKGLLRRFWK
jgi:pilus assembly protein CpaE